MILDLHAETEVKTHGSWKGKRKKTKHAKLTTIIEMPTYPCGPWFGKWAHIPLDNRVSASGTSDDNVLHCTAALWSGYCICIIIIIIIILSQSITVKNKKNFLPLMDPWKSSMALLSPHHAFRHTWQIASSFFSTTHERKKGPWRWQLFFLSLPSPFIGSCNFWPFAWRDCPIMLSEWPSFSASSDWKGPDSRLQTFTNYAYLPT